MFGNRLGWAISTVLVGLFMFLLYSLHVMQHTSELTPAFAADPKALAAVELPVNPETIVTGITEPGDAGDKYREAINDYIDHPKSYAKFDSVTTPELPGVQAVVAATRMKEMHLFSKNPKEIVNYVHDKDSIDAIQAVGTAVGLSGLTVAAKKDYPLATKFAEARFALGMKLFNERLIVAEMDAGLAEMGAATNTLKRIGAETNNKELTDRCDQFDKERIAYSKGPLTARRKWLPAIDGNLLGEHAGDVFELAAKSNDRMWRIEAVLQLGRIRYNVGNNGRGADQVAANRLLRKMAETEKDELVKFAAIQARVLDEPTYNNQTASGHAQ